MGRRVWDAARSFLDPLCEQTRQLVVGPLIRAEHRDRVAQYVDQGVSEGATVLVDGRRHMQRVEAGMVGVNVPVAQPFAVFPFSGWKGAFYGDLHVHGTDGIEFYTRKKMFITRW